MNEEQSIFDLIEKYHQGVLSEDEKALVEKRMQSDAAFAEYLSLQGLTNKLVEAAGTDMLREKMRSDIAALDRKRSRLKWGASLLATLVVVSSLVYFTNYFRKKNIPAKKENKQAAPAHEELKDTSETSVPLKKHTQPVSVTDVPTTTIRNDSLPVLVLPKAVETRESRSDEKKGTVKEEETTSKTVVQNQESKPCDLSFHLIVQPTCKGEKSGTISVEHGSAVGGTRPYYFLSSTGESSSTGNFSDLSKGTYSIVMYDSEGCTAKQHVVLSDRNCSARKSYSFNPDYGEKWNAGLEEGSGKFTIYNRGGMIIFKGSFAENNPAEWYGTNAQGTTMEAGLYVCVLEYLEGKTETIEISVIR